MFTFHVTVKHDTGRLIISTTADSIIGAVSKIMAAESCPERAIINVRRAA